MNLILFALTLLVSFVIIRIGAIAFELTGVELSLAKFQAISCFTGTGFTTRESELITASRQRRKIASILMVLGNAGLVTLIATFANSIRPHENEFSRLPLLGMSIPGFLHPWLNLALLAVFAYALYKVLSLRGVRNWLTGVIRSRLMKGRIIKPVPFDELAVATGGYGVVSIEVGGKNRLPGKTLRETKFREMDITILAIGRGSGTVPNPRADEVIQLGDTLFCFGKIDDIRTHLTE